MTTRKGIVLAGGTGSRLFPLTRGVSKQLLPVYDKPMIYYPLSVLMLAGLRDIAIVTTPTDAAQFKRLLGDGVDWGLHFEYVEQATPRGIAEALVLCEQFLAGAPSALVLGDNVFYGSGLPAMMMRASKRPAGATIFAHPVADPRAFGVVEVDARGVAVNIEEKPPLPKSNLAVTGLYFYDEHAPRLARQLQPSARGELEITDLNRAYMSEGRLFVETLGRGFAWLDTGTPSDLLKAGQLVEVLQERQGLMIASPEEIAFRNGFVTREAFSKLASSLSSSPYGQYLLRLLSD